MIGKSFGIATGLVHKKWNGSIYAYSPYTQEMNLWIHNFETIYICAPVIEQPPDKNESEYIHSNMVFVEMPKLGGRSLYSKIISLVNLPRVLFKLFCKLKSLNHVHLRLPSNIGLYALLLCPFLSMVKTAKYAAQWNDYENEPFTFRIQKKLVSLPFWFRKGKVLIYGEWPGQSYHIVPFFTASYSQAEMREAGLSIAGKSTGKAEYVSLAFVGRVTENKGGSIALETVKILQQKGVSTVLHIVGDGSDMHRLRKYARSLGFTTEVKFYGNLDKSSVSRILMESHFLLSLSRTEGWPKVVAEGMVWGSVPIATAVSCIPWLLGNGVRGSLVERNAASVADAINKYLRYPDSYMLAKDRGHEWALQFTLERLAEAINRLCQT